MKIKINVDRAAAIAVGNEQYGARVVDIPLADIPNELRDELARLPDLDGVTDATGLIDGSISPNDEKAPTLAVADAAGVLATLRWRRAVRAVREARAAEAAAEVARQAREFAQRALDLPIERWIAQSSHLEKKAEIPYIGSMSISARAESETLPEIKARLREAEQMAKQMTVEATERYEASKRAEKERKAAGLAQLREWAQGRGSERLRLMLDLQAGDWLEIARREWMDARAPEGYAHGSFGGDERRKPTLVELQELKRLREAVERSEGVLSDPTIDWVVRESRWSDDLGEEVAGERFAVAEVRVTAPDGESAWYAKRIDPQD